MVVVCFSARVTRVNPGTWVWIGVDDVEALLEDYRAKGYDARHPPTNYPWAYEMQIEDPDGNVLRIGSEAKDGSPRWQQLARYARHSMGKVARWRVGQGRAMIFRAPCQNCA